MLKGIAASSGVTIAPAYKYETPEIQIVKKEGVPEEEIAKFDSAVIASKKIARMMHSTLFIFQPSVSLFRHKFVTI